MALALKSGHRFTVAQLFNKLCKTTCDTCESTAAYIDVFSCSRQCLNVGGNCKPRHVPQRTYEIANIYRLDELQFAQLVSTADSFREIHSDYHSTEDGVPTRVQYYDGEAAAKLSPSVAVQVVPCQLNERRTAVRALHLHRDDSEASSVVLCGKCIEESIRDIEERDWWHLFTSMKLPLKADLAKVVLGFVDDMKTHQAVAHPDITKE